MRIIFGIISLVVLAILVMVLYFYIAFSGNPIERFSQQRAIITDYEARYDEDFKIISSSYDYKRNEFSYTISSKNHPEIIFTTTLDEAGRIDKYAAARLRQNQYIVDLSWAHPLLTLCRSIPFLLILRSVSLKNWKPQLVDSRSGLECLTEKITIPPKLISGNHH